MAVTLSGTGKYIPEKIVHNDAFILHQFYTPERGMIDQPNERIISKFKDITGISERRYGRDDQQTSDLATIAAERDIKDAGINAESLDGIIVAHNFGNIPFGQTQTDEVPSLASRVKHNLRIENPACVAYDILSGCPGWMQGLIVAYQYILAGSGTRYLVIGAEMLSRVIDKHDRDSMIFADGAGATVLQLTENTDSGIISTLSYTYSYDEAYYLHFDESHNTDYTPDTRYLKMQGRKIYEFALNKVPAAMKTCLEKASIPIGQLKKIFIHQANEKMDEAIIKRFYSLYGIGEPPVNIFPMSIHKLGNSSVATIPTLYDMVLKGELPEHQLAKGDIILLASVGAGMNVSAIVYRV
jgi:3-oxoacyl-[acyl-carrier-protein] synthase-3